MPDPQYMRDKHHSVSLTAVVDGVVKDFGVWQKLDGGDVTSEATKTFPGGGKPEVVVPGGPASTDKITLTRQFDRLRDATSDHARLTALVGTGAEMTVTQAFLGYDNIPFGTPIVDTGVIESCTRPKADANGDGLSEFSITINPKGK